jgi:drug/metabolite transporter (DMT)-like permease
MPVVLACLASLCFGAGLVTAKFGLRLVDARAGAAMSVPTAAVFFVAVSLVWLDVAALDWRAVAVFALVGLFFPAAVTIINFVSADRIGPALTSSVSGTSPLFGIVAALAVLGEPIPARALLATIGIVAGVALMSWGRTALGAPRLGWLLCLPVAAAAIRGLSQVFAKLGLAMWPSPLAASLVGYLVSAGVLLIADRARSGRRAGRPPRRAVVLFVATGLLNGIGLMMTYVALQNAPVALVVPIVAAFPVVTLALTVALVRDEPIGRRTVLGAALTLAAVMYLVAG